MLVAFCACSHGEQLPITERPIPLRNCHDGPDIHGVQCDPLTPEEMQELTRRYFLRLRAEKVSQDAGPAVILIDCYLDGGGDECTRAQSVIQGR
jgi:hypothetical protein